MHFPFLFSLYSLELPLFQNHLIFFFPKLKMIRISFTLSMINDLFLAFFYNFFHLPETATVLNKHLLYDVMQCDMEITRKQKESRVDADQELSLLLWWGEIVSIDATCKKPYLSRHFASSFNMENEITIKWAVKTCIFQTMQSLIHSLLAQLQYILYHILFH